MTNQNRNVMVWWNWKIAVMSLCCAAVLIMTNTSITSTAWGTMVMYLICLGLWNMQQSGGKD